MAFQGGWIFIKSLTHGSGPSFLDLKLQAAGREANITDLQNVDGGGTWGEIPTTISVLQVRKLGHRKGKQTCPKSRDGVVSISQMNFEFSKHLIYFQATRGGMENPLKFD